MIIKVKFTVPNEKFEKFREKMGNTDDEFEKFLKESMTASDGVRLGCPKKGFEKFSEILQPSFLKCYPWPYVKQELGATRMEFVEFRRGFSEKKLFENYT